MTTETRPRFFLRQIEQHYNKQVEHQDSAGVHDDLHRCQELRSKQEENPRHVQKKRQHPQHAMHWIFPGHGQQRAGDTGAGHVIKDCGQQDRFLG